ncbi:MAG: SOS response-associated peptidase [SAR324 cluster bacterium]|nr:SOS response-associated peptidase [SAR324 cluster bacterium]
MCGRFNVHDLSGALLWLFGMSEGPQQPPRYNIAPSQQVATVRNKDQGEEREVVLLRWGLLPHWAKDPAMGTRMINARAETVAEKPSFRAAYRRRRCLFPAWGYYEWRNVEGGKQPYYIYLKQDKPFAMAGLWEHWQDEEGTQIETCAIITTEANPLTRPIHHRMPVIIAKEQIDRWLDPSVEGGDALGGLLKPYSDAEMAAHPVSTHVNRPANNDPQCMAALEK